MSKLKEFTDTHGGLDTREYQLVDAAVCDVLAEFEARADALMSLHEKGNAWNCYAAGCMQSLVTEIRNRSR